MLEYVCSCHSTHAHSAEAVAAEVSRENATSSEALRGSRITASPSLAVANFTLTFSALLLRPLLSQ
jgi:hypothetical protein